MLFDHTIFIRQADTFSSLLDQGSYFEAHEAFELIWFDIRHHKSDPEVLLLRALINAAVAFELIKRGRPHAAQKPWNFFKAQISLRQKSPSNRQIIYDDLYQNILNKASKLEII